ncbi:hypothetical protein SAMN03159423_4507 [Bradyrhizobium sp. NFR13]|uniref:hypothetical protein n=1 Tax=Bradyrhizobium sp. NFR13 TaxID=1566285 RepID=UPI0008E3B4B8|nr:hypothetical protein [Bradyrhizobium sp. NFR13]SFL93558.1 hypothetical protein SAMN03159423_4507 [Bradyrhizobium sp. NFR13]
MSRLPTPTTTRTSQGSPGTDLPLASELAAIRLGWEDGHLSAPLPEPVRERLTKRLELLRSCSRPAAVEAIEEEVAKLMLGFPSTRGVPVIEVQLQVRKYAEDLLGVPLWAIKDACRDISRGSVPGLNPDFPPTSPRLRLVVNGYVTKVHHEAQQIKQVLHAPILRPADPAVWESIRAGLVARSRELSCLHDTPPKPAPTLQEIEEHYANHGLAFERRRDIHGDRASDDREGEG